MIAPNDNFGAVLTDVAPGDSGAAGPLENDLLDFVTNFSDSGVCTVATECETKPFDYNRLNIPSGEMLSEVTAAGDSPHWSADHHVKRSVIVVVK